MRRFDTDERLSVVKLSRHERVCVTRTRAFTPVEVATWLLGLPLSIVATCAEFVAYALGVRNCFAMLAWSIVSFVGFAGVCDLRSFLVARRFRRMIASPSLWLSSASYRRYEPAIAAAHDSREIECLWPELVASATSAPPLLASR